MRWASEIDTPEGKAAKQFVESRLESLDFITIKSTKTRREKWGRYLADVFVESRGRSAAGPIYLNQLLLDEGHAVRVRW